MKLDDLNKKNIYKVPEGYFDELPGRIQKRIEAEKEKSAFSSWNLSTSLKIAAPALAIALLIFFVVFQRPEKQKTLSYDEILNEVSVDEMISYLEMTDVTTDEILEEVNPENMDESFDDIDKGIIMDEEIDNATLDALIDEYNIDLDDI